MCNQVLRFVWDVQKYSPHMVNHHHSKHIYNHRHSAKSKKIHMKYASTTWNLEPISWIIFPVPLQPTPVTAGSVSSGFATTLAPLIVPLPLHNLYALLRLAVHRLAVDSMALIPSLPKGMGDQWTCNTLLESTSVDIHRKCLTWIRCLLPFHFGGQQKTPKWMVV